MSEELTALRAEVAELRRVVDSILRGVVLLTRHLGAVARPATETGPRIATDAELDGHRGDPAVHKDPKRWEGASYRGEPMSRCPPEYLDELASFLDWKAERDREDAEGVSGKERSEKLKYASYSEKDAALARGWARRLRANAPSPTTEEV